MTDKNYDDKLFIEVDRWTRAGKRGKELFCPKCGSETRIYHFDWSTVKCGNSKKFEEKYKWLIPTKIMKRKNFPLKHTGGVDA